MSDRTNRIALHKPTTALAADLRRLLCNAKPRIGDPGQVLCGAKRLDALQVVLFCASREAAQKKSAEIRCQGLSAMQKGGGVLKNQQGEGGTEDARFIPPTARCHSSVDMEKFRGFSLYRELRACEQCDDFILNLTRRHNNRIDVFSKECSGYACDFFGADSNV